MGSTEVLMSPSAEAAQLAEEPPSDSKWIYSPSGDSLFYFNQWGDTTAPEVTIDHTAFPSSSEAPSSSAADHTLGVSYRNRLFNYGFLESQSIIDETGFGHFSRGYRQVVGYGLRILDRQTVTFDIVPGVVGDYAADESIENRLKWMGNLNQNFSWQVSDGLVLNQNFNTTLERTDTDNLSAVLNLDLETLFSDRLSFKLSYEVHYDDTVGEEMEQRDARLSTSVGFRF